MRDREREPDGFTLIEVLVGLLILGFVMTTSLAAFYERERRTRHAEEVFLVWQAISNEAELTRYRSWKSLQPGSTEEFRSDLEILSTLENVATSVEVSEIEPLIRSVTLSVAWGEDRSARVELIRTDTGGTNLW